MNTLRREQLALALTTLSSRHEPSASRCTAVLAPVMWIFFRSGIWVNLVAHSDKSGLLCLNYQDCSITHDIPSIGEIGDRPETDIWDQLPQELVRAAWNLMRPEDMSKAGNQLRTTVKALIEQLRKEDEES